MEALQAASWAAAPTLSPRGQRESRRDVAATIRTFGDTAAWQAAIACLLLGAPPGLQRDVFAASSAIQAVAKSGLWQQGLALLDWTASEGLETDVVSGTAALSACRIGGRWAQGCYILGRLRQAAACQVGKGPNVSASQEGGIAGGPSVRTYGSALATCERAAAWRQSAVLSEEMAAASLCGNDITSAMVVGACARAEAWGRAFDLVVDCRRVGIEINLITHSVALGACAAAETADWLQALSQLSYVYEVGLRTDVLVVTDTLSACERDRCWNGALYMLYEMGGSGLVPNIVTFSAGISACEAVGKSTDALRLLITMRHDRIAPQVISYNAAVSACAKGHAWEDGLWLCFDDMAQQSVERDVITWNSAANTCEKGIQWEKALQILAKNLAGQTTGGVQPDTVTCNAVISSCEKGLQWVVGLDALTRSAQHGLRATTVTYNAATSVAVAGQSWQTAFAIQEVMNVRRLGVTEATCGAVVAAATVAANQAVASGPALHLELSAMLAGMRDRHLEPDSLAYSAAIQAVAQAGNWQAALSLLEDMLGAGFLPDVMACAATVEACCSAASCERLTSVTLISELRQRATLCMRSF
eukprot:TRINITY_DN53411_c0_g1_i1.p1 TRINITY_DN53411_c0_g1~~TRINITY_DN53411_c0_g1_i1.p1  ORF type:complete len:589 (+),score=105.65 TRINITY_DN53411_c0_g1_i1:77-1843(+)